MRLKNKDITLRKVRRSDCLDIWRWRNSPEVKKACLRKGAVPLETHKKWFDKKFDNPSTDIYIAHKPSSGRKIGVVRFDKEGRDAVVSANLNPEFIGMGLGPFILKRATVKYMKTGKAGKVIAVIKKGNLRSQKAFLKADYRYKDDGIENGNKVRIYWYTREG